MTGFAQRTCSVSANSGKSCAVRKANASGAIANTAPANAAANGRRLGPCPVIAAAFVLRRRLQCPPRVGTEAEAANPTRCGPALRWKVQSAPDPKKQTTYRAPCAPSAGDRPAPGETPRPPRPIESGRLDSTGALDARAFRPRARNP